MRHSFCTLALAGTLIMAATPAVAQDSEAMQQELAEMRAMMAKMATRIDTLEAELEAVEASADAAPVAAAPQAAVPEADAPAAAFKGAPEIKADGGWSFKPRGRLQLDAGSIAIPDSIGREGGFGSEVRRARLGVAGDIPGGFGYKFEVDFAGGEVNVADAILSYGTGDVEVMVGQMNNFQGLEELTSSLHTSFIERAAFTDAFGFERRVGAALSVGSGDVLVQAGVFTDNMNDLPGNKNWSVDGRAVYAPRIGEAQLHLGGSVHYNELQSGSSLRYRQRPLVHFTGDRYVNTGSFDAESEFGLGLEAAFISGPFHVAAESFWQSVALPTAMEDPTFFGGSVEAGYFLTSGDTRGYKGGKFDRTKPANPLGEGGFGSLQLNLRYDRLDLSDAGIIGGTQDGYMASLVWKPSDYVMLLANYGHLAYTDAAFPTLSGDRDYAADVIAMRAQIDF